MNLRVIPRESRAQDGSRFMRLEFPMNFITAPLIADLFLLAILAIGQPEVYRGTIGSDNIEPIDIMVFFLTLAYIAISIDASGLIRYLAFRVLSWGGEVGHRLFFYLYAFFFALGSFIGNDPIILSGTAFLAYMTRVSNNIEHPRAWIHTQFAVANIASATLVSSNPTNLVLVGAFKITFIDYTANMVVPVVITAIVVFPFLLYIIFAHERLIPIKITMHKLPEEIKAKKPINPNIPNIHGDADEWEDEHGNDEHGKLLSLEEIMNPFLDKGGATFGAVIMTATLVTLLGVNAASQKIGKHPVYWVTLPAAFVMFCWDVAFGWIHRQETREIAQNGRKAIEQARKNRLTQEQEAASAELVGQDKHVSSTDDSVFPAVQRDDTSRENTASESWDSNLDHAKNIALTEIHPRSDQTGGKPTVPSTRETNGDIEASPRDHEKDEAQQARNSKPATDTGSPVFARPPWSLVSLVEEAYRWCRETFPTVTAVLAHLPFALVPFAFCMFVLVEALVTKGWVPVFAYGWDHWVNKTGTIGAIGGMGFLSVILCNVSPSSNKVSFLPLMLARHSSLVPILVQQSYCHVSFRPGSRSMQRTMVSLTVPSGLQSTLWRWVSIMEPLAWLSALR